MQGNDVAHLGQARGLHLMALAGAEPPRNFSQGRAGRISYFDRSHFAQVNPRRTSCASVHSRHTRYLTSEPTQLSPDCCGTKDSARSGYVELRWLPIGSSRQAGHELCPSNRERDAHMYCRLSRSTLRGLLSTKATSSLVRRATSLHPSLTRCCACFNIGGCLAAQSLTLVHQRMRCCSMRCACVK